MNIIKCYGKVIGVFINYDQNLIMLTMSRVLTENLDKRKNFKDLHILTTKDKGWDNNFDVKITNSTTKEDIAYYIRDCLLFYLGTCYFWDFSDFINMNGGIVDPELLFTWSYEKSSSEFQIW